MKELKLFIEVVLLTVFVLLFAGCASNKPFVKSYEKIYVRDTVTLPGDTIMLNNQIKVSNDFDRTFQDKRYSLHITIKNDSLGYELNIFPVVKIITKTIIKKIYTTPSIEKKKLVIDRKETLDSLKNKVNIKRLDVRQKVDSLRIDLRKQRAKENTPGFFGRIWLKFKDTILWISLALNAIVFLKGFIGKILTKLS